MSHWPTKKLGDIAKIKGGKRLPKGEQLITEKTRHPYIRAQDIRNKRITFDDPHYITEEIYKEIERYTVQEDDVVLTIVGAGIGEIGVVPKKLDGANLTENAVKLIELKELDPQYLFYALLDDHAQNQIYNLAAGAAQPKLGIYKVKRIEIPYPDLSTQREIASTLSSFDDLIENNTRRIEILEEMARRIYREWFVHFRYPGHEDDELVDSGTDLGEIPEGWDIVHLSDLVSSQYGYTESADEDEVGPMFIRGTDINKASYIDWSTVPYCPIDEDDYQKFKVNIGDILVVRMGSPGETAIIEEEKDAVFASYLIRLVIQDDRLTPYYLFYTMNDHRYQGFVTGASTGTTRKSASAKVIKNFDLLLPPNALLHKFEEQISLLRKQLNTLMTQNNRLKETRDLLLPKLISGKIDVEEMINIPA